MSKSNVIVVFLAIVVSLLILAVGINYPSSSSEVLTVTRTGQPTATTDLDGGVSVTNTVERCGVEVTWWYLDGEVSFKNLRKWEADVEYLAPEGRYDFTLSAGGTHTIEHQALYRGREVDLIVKSGARTCREGAVLGK